MAIDPGQGALLWCAARSIGPPRFDFDAAVPSTGIDGQSFARTGKQKKGETKENDRGCCCVNAERDDVEQGADMGLRCRGVLIRGIGARTCRFGRLWPRVLGGEVLCPLVE